MTMQNEKLLKVMTEILVITTVRFKRDLVDQNQTVAYVIRPKLLKIQPITVTTIKIRQNPLILTLSSMYPSVLLMCDLSKKTRLSDTRKTKETAYHLLTTLRSSPRTDIMTTAEATIAIS